MGRKSCRKQQKQLSPQPAVATPLPPLPPGSPPSREIWDWLVHPEGKMEGWRDGCRDLEDLLGGLEDQGWCMACGVQGHTVAICPFQGEEEEEQQPGCYCCAEPGHSSTNCPWYPLGQLPQRCPICGGEHFVAHCPVHQEREEQESPQSPPPAGGGRLLLPPPQPQVQQRPEEPENLFPWCTWCGEVDHRWRDCSEVPPSWCGRCEEGGHDWSGCPYASSPVPKREEPERPQPKEEEVGASIALGPKLPAEGECLLVPPPPAEEKCLLSPCAPAEDECLLVSLPPPAEGECLLGPRPPAEDECLLVTLPQPAEDECLLVTLPQPAEDECLLQRMTGCWCPPAASSYAAEGSTACTSPAATAEGASTARSRAAGAASASATTRSRGAGAASASRTSATGSTVAGAPKRGAAGHEEGGGGLGTTNPSSSFAAGDCGGGPETCSHGSSFAAGILVAGAPQEGATGYEEGGGQGTTCPRSFSAARTVPTEGVSLGAVSTSADSMASSSLATGSIAARGPTEVSLPSPRLCSGLLGV
ncbi:UNVERIFIED_CONTAM: hypothetical protein FKN15_048323 [Acipenser sinensis]